MQHSDMAQHAAALAVDGHIDGSMDDEALEAGEDLPQAVARAENVVSHLTAEAVIPADGEDGDARGTAGRPGRAIAAGVALGEPAQLLDGRLAVADALESVAALEAETAEQR